MRKLLTLTLFTFTFLFSQDRSIVFNTGPAPWTCSESGGVYDNYLCDAMCGAHLGNDNCIIVDEGFSIGQDNSAAERFTLNYDYAFEAFGLYLKTESLTALNAVVRIQDDIDGSPGNILGEWTISVSNLSTYYSLYTGDSCVDFIAGNYYWLSVHYIEDPANTITWLQTQSDYWYTSQSNDSGQSWGDTTFGYGGAAAIWAERIYESDWQPSSDGDINYDGIANILDIVGLVSFVLENIEFTDEQQVIADMNIDGVINILDIVQLVNFVLFGPSPMPLFSYEDINPASSSYGQFIGPETYVGDVSLYYFGKAG